MRIRIYAISFVVAIASLPLLAAQQQSLGDLARQLRQKQSEAGRKANRVYTNDNLPTHPQEETPAAAPSTSNNPGAASSDKTQARPGSSQTAEEPARRLRQAKRPAKHLRRAKRVKSR